MTPDRYVPRKTDHGTWAVCRGDDKIVFCGRQRAQRTARYLTKWQPTEQQLDAFVAWGEPEAKEYAATMRRIRLRWDACCLRCGQTIPAGTRARWHPESKVILHSKQPCPMPDVRLEKHE